MGLGLRLTRQRVTDADTHSMLQCTHTGATLLSLTHFRVNKILMWLIFCSLSPNINSCTWHILFLFFPLPSEWFHLDAFLPLSAACSVLFAPSDLNFCLHCKQSSDIRQPSSQMLSGAAFSCQFHSAPPFSPRSALFSKFSWSRCGEWTNLTEANITSTHRGVYL